MVSTTISISTTVVLIIVALSTTVLSDLIMPGVRRASVRDRAARTPPPLFPPNDRIFFPGGNTGELPAVIPAQPQGAPFNRGAAPAPVLPLPSDISEMDSNSLSRLNTVSDIIAFAQLFNVSLPVANSAGSFLISERFGDSGNDEGESYEMANCKPELVTVPLDLPVEPNTMFFPTCIRLEQCGGCCFGPLLTCRPSVTKIVKVKVLKVNAAGTSRGSNRNRRQNPSSYEVVEAVKHTACECGCRVRQEDCNSVLHTYFEGECSCVCKNKDEKEKCEQQNTTKYWDNNSCSCYCRKPLNCGSGEFFSQVSCSCERLVARGGFLPAEPEVVQNEGEVLALTELPNIETVPWMLPTTRPRRNKPVRVPLNSDF